MLIENVEMVFVVEYVDEDGCVRNAHEDASLGGCGDGSDERLSIQDRSQVNQCGSAPSCKRDDLWAC